MAVWHLGVGRHTEKLRAAALPRKGGWIPGVLDYPFPTPILLPLEGYERNQCRTRPSLRLKGGFYPSWDEEQGWEMLRQSLQAGGQNATDSTVMGKRKGQERRISSQEAQGPYGPCGQGAASKW